MTQCVDLLERGITAPGKAVGRGARHILDQTEPRLLGIQLDMDLGLMILQIV